MRGKTNQALLKKLKREAEKKISNISHSSDSENYDLKKLVFELELHKTELEMQNQELQVSSFQTQHYSIKYSSLFEFAPVGLFVLDKYGLIKNVNISFCKLLDYEDKEILDRRFQALVHPDSQYVYFCLMRDVLYTKEKQSAELQLVKKDGNLLYVILETIIIPDKELEGECLSAILDNTGGKDAKTLLDVQQTLEKEKQRVKHVEDDSVSLLEIAGEKLRDSEKIVGLYKHLVESEKKLKEQNENKDKFFALLSHDLRTPFYGIMGFAKLLNNKIDTLTKDEIKLYASHVYTLSQNFDKLMNDLLAWCNVQMNNVSFDPEKVCICKTIEETIKIFSENAKEKQIEVVWSCKMDHYVRADENMVKSVFRNLLSNALKFTNLGGRVVVESKCHEDYCEISIADNGVGMSDRIKEKVFKISEHTGSTGTANEKGTGLGLILCKEFIEKHGGKIWFESEQGKGTTFYFTLPNFN